MRSFETNQEPSTVPGEAHSLDVKHDGRVCVRKLQRSRGEPRSPRWQTFDDAVDHQVSTMFEICVFVPCHVERSR